MKYQNINILFAENSYARRNRFFRCRTQYFVYGDFIFKGYFKTYLNRDIK